MNLSVKWSPRASEDYREILDYIITRFGLASARKFDKQVEEVLEMIIQFPFMYPALGERTDKRCCVISKQTTLYYRVSSEVIELITFWNNRRNPSSLNIEG